MERWNGGRKQEDKGEQVAHLANGNMMMMMTITVTMTILKKKSQSHKT